MRQSVEMAREYLLSGLWTVARVNTLLSRGKITQEEYDYIVAPAK